MTTIIIEDEKPAARLLQRKLEKLNIQVGVMFILLKSRSIGFLKMNILI